MAGRQPAVAGLRRAAAVRARPLPAHDARADARLAAPEAARARRERGRPSRRLLERRVPGAAADPRARRRRHRARQHAARRPLGTGLPRAPRVVRLGGRVAGAADRLPAGRVQPRARARRVAGRARRRGRLLHLRVRAPRPAVPAPRVPRPLRARVHGLRRRGGRHPGRPRACCRTTAGRWTSPTGPMPCRRASDAWGSSRCGWPRSWRRPRVRRACAWTCRSTAATRSSATAGSPSSPRPAPCWAARAGPARSTAAESSSRASSAAGRAAVPLLRRVRRRAARRLGRQAARGDRPAPPGGRGREDGAGARAGRLRRRAGGRASTTCRCGRTSPTSTRWWSAWATPPGAGARRARVPRPRAQRALRLRGARRAARAGARRGAAPGGRRRQRRVAARAAAATAYSPAGGAAPALGVRRGRPGRARRGVPHPRPRMAAPAAPAAVSWRSGSAAAT